MLSLRFEEFATASAPIDRRIFFRFYRNGEPHTRARIDVLSYLLMGIDAQPEALEAALCRVAARRLEAMAAADAVLAEYASDFVLEVRLDENDAPAVLQALDQKECRYQVVLDGADIFCGAAARSDETVSASQGLRLLAPTSQALCNACTLPSTDLICSHLSHPQVIGTMSGGGWDRILGGAMCDLGHEGAWSAPMRCRPGPEGHACWERIVSTLKASVSTNVPPLAVPEAVDFLDAVWRLRFGERLVQHIATVHIASLAVPVNDRDEFKARLSDLAGVIESFHISDSMLSAAIDAKAKTGSLNRLQAALDQASVPYAPEEIARLRNVVAIRTALQHPGRAKDLLPCFEQLGVRYPPTSWTEAWAAVQDAVVTALGAIRSAVRQGTD